MLNQLENLTQRVGGAHQLIDKWLQDRKQLLVEYYHIIGKKTNKTKPAPLDENALANFCQNIVDYLSAGHFQIYDNITTSTDSTSEHHLILINKLYPKLEENTAFIMEFYDRYSNATINDDNYLTLNHDLSTIGEQLATRFAIEDKLIEIAAITSAKKNQPR